MGRVAKLHYSFSPSVRFGSYLPLQYCIYVEACAYKIPFL